MGLRGLTLFQPWATIVAKGLKPIENRKWAPGRAMIGERFAIHAGQKWDKDGELFIRKTFAHDESVIEAIGDAVLVRMAVLGVARLVGYMSKEDGLFHTRAGDRMVADRFHPLAGNPWFFGPYGYVLEDVRELATPVHARGALSFWHLPPEVDDEVMRQVEAH
jgi:hypothetical protein